MISLVQTEHHSYYQTSERNTNDLRPSEEKHSLIRNKRKAN